MKTIKKKIFSTAALILMSTLTYAQFTMDGEVRPRFEYRNGYQSPSDSAQDNAAFVEQRTRLNFGYKTEGYLFKVVLQDVHIWGSQPQLINSYTKLNTDGSYLSLHEAWGEALMSDKWSFKFGRQEIILDDHRIFGSVGWASQARSHDAAILKFKSDKLQVQIAGAYNQDKVQKSTVNAFNGSYKAFQYLWLHNDFSENFGASVLFLNNGKQVADWDSTISAAPTQTYKDNYSQTAGTRISYKKDKLAANVAFYSQFGTFEDVTNSSINAMNIGVDISYKATEKLTATAGFEYMSGQSQTDTNKSYTDVKHAFNPFYGTNHKFNGFMDYFYVGNHAGSVGLQDIYFKLKYKADKFWVGTDVHLFSATADVRDGFKVQEDIAAAIVAGTPVADVNQLQAMSAGLGTEIDVTFGFNLSKGVAFKGGYSHMLATETMTYLRGVTDYAGQGRTDQTNNWGWAMIIIKPKFITPAEKKK